MMCCSNCCTNWIDFFMFQDLLLLCQIFCFDYEYCSRPLIPEFPVKLPILILADWVHQIDQRDYCASSSIHRVVFTSFFANNLKNSVATII